MKEAAMQAPERRTPSGQLAAVNRKLLEGIREFAGQPRQQTGEHQAMTEAEARALLAVHEVAISREKDSRGHHPPIPREDPDDEPDTDPETRSAKEAAKRKDLR